MSQVIVTNEFTRMNTGPERRPLKVLTPSERSSKMVIARYANRPHTKRQQVDPRDPQQELLWKAVRVGGLFAAFAFAFLAFSQHNWFERTGSVSVATPDSVQRLSFAPSLPEHTDAKMITEPAHGSPPFTVPDSPTLTVTEFNLPVTPEFQSVSNVDLRITSVNPATGTYDITIRTPYREFYRQDVKLSEHIPLSKNEADGREMVVGAIAQNRVYGYVTEPRHRGHRRHRRH